MEMHEQLQDMSDVVKVATEWVQKWQKANYNQHAKKRVLSWCVKARGPSNFDIAVFITFNATAGRIMVMQHAVYEGWRTSPPEALLDSLFAKGGCEGGTGQDAGGEHHLAIDQSLGITNGLGP